MLVALVYFPNWQVHSLVVDTPPAAPAAVVDKQQVVSLTPTASARGVKIGMRQTLALHLCPDLRIMPADSERSARSFQRVLQALDEVGAQVHALVPGIAWMPAEPLLKWHGQQEKVCETIIDTVSRHTASDCLVGIGQGLLGAWVSVQTGDLVSHQCAKVEDFPLANLMPLCQNNVTQVEATISQLSELGITTVKQCRKLGRKHLHTRYGKAGAFLAALIEDQQTPLPLPLQADVTYRETLTFPGPVNDLDHVLLNLQQVSEKLVETCMGKQLSPRRIHIRARLQTLSGQVERKRGWSLLEVANTRDLLDRLRWQLQGWVNEIQNQPQVNLEFADLPTGVTWIQIEADSLVSVADLSPTLWGGTSAVDSRAEAGAYRLQTLVGEDNVRYINVDEGFDPLSRVRSDKWGSARTKPAWHNWQPGDGRARGTNFQPGQRWKGALPAPAPATVFRSGIEVQLLSGVTPVQVDASGGLESIPTALKLPSAAKDAQQQVSLDLLHKCIGYGTVNVTSIEGPWPVLGRWWRQNGAGKVWVKLHPDAGPALLAAWHERQWFVHAVWY
ncbi:MAG: hypothetical protein Q4P06_00695 [Actinomycetaceae bacterium]|nr:hypothetical protein [Actinomycetaceae bacterium]